MEIALTVSKETAKQFPATPRSGLAWLGWKGSVRDYRLYGNGQGTCKPHPKQDRIERHTAARRAFRWVARDCW